MTIIHRQENTRYSGCALYLNPTPVHGNGIYLNSTGGMIGIPNMMTKMLEFGNRNSGLIKDGITSVSQAASAISDIKKAADDAKKLARKSKEVQPKLSDREKELIEDAIRSVKEGSGLKRF